VLAESLAGMASSDKVPAKRLEFRNPSKEGWLDKQSRHLKRWKKRWFVLQDSTLYSFKKEKVYDVPTEIIDLRVFSSVKSSEDYTNRSHSFDVYSADMCFSMVAASENEKEDWIRAIGRAIVISRTKSWQDENEEDDHGTSKKGENSKSAAPTAASGSTKKDDKRNVAKKLKSSRSNSVQNNIHK